jgi:alpha-glucosidase (family GH31 glycosyl hydrolase)
MNMNMFGFTHTGADACGSTDEHKTTEMNEELCLRWIQLATFFPLARHSQDFSANSSYLTGPLGFKNDSLGHDVWLSMRDRMQYLRFMYTCLFESSKFGGSCFDPLYFHYNTDVKTKEEVTGTNDTFIFGSAVKVSPLVTPAKGAKTFKSYFPKGRWVNLATLETKVSEGSQIDLNI